MCQRAYFSFNLMTKDNQLKAYQLDQPDGATERQLKQENEEAEKGKDKSNEEEQNSPVVPPLGLSARPQGASQVSILDSVLDGSVHVGDTDKLHPESLVKLEALN